MLRTCLVATLMALLPAAATAAALKIAVVAPAAGNLVVLGEQVRMGARLAASGKAELIEIEESCAEKSGPAIAEKIKASGATAAIGFLCADSLEGGLPILAAASITTITLSARSPVLMEDALKKNWPFFRLAPSATDERSAIIAAIFETWKDKPFALLDDGTITSREMVDTVRQALEEKGMKPAFTDNFRPAQEVQTQLLRRLSKAGVTHIFAAADRGDMSVMARDARAAKLNLTFMGGDALNASDQPVPLEKGVLAVVIPAYGAQDSARPVLDALGKDEPAEGYVLPAHAAITTLLDAAEIASGSGAPLAAALIETPFSTAIGEVRFSKSHELARNLFELMEWNGSAFIRPVVTN